MPYSVKGTFKVNKACIELTVALLCVFIYSSAWICGFLFGNAVWRQWVIFIKQRFQTVYSELC